MEDLSKDYNDVPTVIMQLHDGDEIMALMASIGSQCDLISLWGCKPQHPVGLSQAHEERYKPVWDCRLLRAYMGLQAPTSLGTTGSYKPISLQGNRDCRLLQAYEPTGL